MNEIVLEIKNLTKYYGKFKAISNINLQVSKGTIHGFLGPNGAGKTTTIRLLLGLLRSTEGQISLFGTPITSKTTYLHDKIGYIPGDVSLYGHMTVSQQLNYISSLHSKCEATRLEEFAERFDLDITKHNRGLSKGNRQKVAIVQAFMHNPDLYIFDEPTSGLDPLMQQVLYDVIKEEAKKGKTFFFSSHNLVEVQNLANIVTIIRNGEIISTTNVKDLGNKVVQKIEVTLGNNYDLEKLGDLQIISHNENHWTILISNITALPSLLKTISEQELQSLSIFPPSLEDYFMKFYGKNNTNIG